MFKWISDLKAVDSPTEVYDREDRQAMADQMRDPQTQISELSEMLECLTLADLNWIKQLSAAEAASGIQLSASANYPEKYLGPK